MDVFYFNDQKPCKSEVRMFQCWNLRPAMAIPATLSSSSAVPCPKVRLSIDRD